MRLPIITIEGKQSDHIVHDPIIINIEDDIIKDIRHLAAINMLMSAQIRYKVIQFRTMEKLLPMLDDLDEFAMGLERVAHAFKVQH